MQYQARARPSSRLEGLGRVADSAAASPPGSAVSRPAKGCEPGSGRAPLRQSAYWILTVKELLAGWVLLPLNVAEPVVETVPVVGPAVTLTVITACWPSPIVLTSQLIVPPAAPTGGREQPTPPRVSCVLIETDWKTI